MQRGVDDNISAHLSDEELAEYIDNRVDDARQMEIERHLVECDECSDVLALVVKYGEEVEVVEKKNDVKSDDYKVPQVANQDYVQIKYANNWFYNERVRAIVLSGVVASLLIFIIPSGENKPFIEFYLHNEYTGFKVPAPADIKDIKAKNQEINKFLEEIVESTDMSYLEEFNQAEEELKRENFDDARELYQKAMNRVDEENFDKREKSKQHIIITYKILQLSMAEGDNESADEYKDVLKDNVRRFRNRWLQLRNRQN